MSTTTQAVECPSCRNKMMVEIPRVGAVLAICPYCQVTVRVTSDLEVKEK